MNNDIRKIKEILELLDLETKETDLYIQLLRLGEQPASVIARQTNLKRTTVYDILSKLIKKGLAHKISSKNVTKFKVLHGEDLLLYLNSEKQLISSQYDDKIRLIKENLSSFEKIEFQSPSRPNVRYFEGEKGMREAYEDTLKSSEYIRAYANIKEMHEALPHFFPEYYHRRSKAGIFIETIAPDNEISKERKLMDKKELREIKFINKDEYEFTPEINIYDDKVLFASWKEKMAIIIESGEIADALKKIFDVLYKNL